MNRNLGFALVLLAACGTKAAADATTTEDVTLDVASSDTQDAVADAAGPTQTDAGGDTAVKLSPAAQACADMAAQICSTAKTCCTAGIGPDCATTQIDACMKSGFAGIDDASAAGVVKLDAVRGKACQDALDAAAKSCDYVGLQAARHQCLLAWLDTASKGDQCTASAPIACDSFSGRCSPVTVDLYTCKTAGATGDKCSTTELCGVDLECLNGTLTRSMTCGKPGSTCNLSDTCPQGTQCAAGNCTPWDGGGKDGVTCKADNECAVGFKCDVVKCAPSLCGL